MRAIALLLLLAGCRGVPAPAESEPWMEPPVAREPAPLGILAGLLRPREAGRHVRVEPAPILSDREIGFGLTVHW